MALVLRDSLRVAVKQANDLAKALKHHRRESQFLKSTLEQLQRAAA